MPERTFSWPVYDIFTTADGKQLFVSAVTEGQWATLCDILGLQGLKADPRLQTKMDTINARSWTLPIVTAVIAGRQFDELVNALEVKGISFSPIAKPGDMFSHPHVMRPGGRAPALPFEVDGTMMTGGGDLPEVGQHTAEVLGALGLSANDIEAARGQRPTRG
jgi:crotonobetainyl-CoA:carnitine CoA-transferase CaiB-like acyl-CoA transferase